MKYLEISLVEHCNLNCKYCSHFSPLADKIFANIEATEYGLKLLKNIIGDNLEEIRLLGGEPLLHPQINDFCRMVRSYFNNANIDIVTNGILLSKLPSEFWSVCHMNRINIKITKYPIKLNIAEISKVASDYNVKLLFTNRSKLIKLMNHMPLDIEGGQDFSRNFANCYSSYCTNLKGSILMPCPIVASIEHFNKYFNKNLTLSKEDCLDLSTVTSIKEIEEFLNKPKPFCSYCMRDKITFDLPWEISTKDIKEWTL